MYDTGLRAVGITDLCRLIRIIIWRPDSQCSDVNLLSLSSNTQKHTHIYSPYYWPFSRKTWMIGCPTVSISTHSYAECTTGQAKNLQMLLFEVFWAIHLRLWAHHHSKGFWSIRFYGLDTSVHQTKQCHCQSTEGNKNYHHRFWSFKLHSFRAGDNYINLPIVNSKENQQLIKLWLSTHLLIISKKQ